MTEPAWVRGGWTTQSFESDIQAGGAQPSPRSRPSGPSSPPPPANDNNAAANDNSRTRSAILGRRLIGPALAGYQMGQAAGPAVLADRYRENPDDFVLVGRFFFSSVSLFDFNQSQLHGRYWTDHTAVVNLISGGGDVREALGLHPDYNSMDSYAIGLIYRSDFNSYVDVTPGGAAAWGGTMEAGWNTT